MKLRRIINLIALSFLLTSCSPVSIGEQSQVIATELQLGKGLTVGQSFVAKNNGLSSISFYFAPQEEKQGEIVFHLRSSPNSNEDLALGFLPINQIAGPGFYRIYFDPQPQSRRQYYYGFMEIEGTSIIGIGTISIDSYLDGAAYVNHEPVQYQIPFKMSYDPGLMTIGFITELRNWIAIFVAELFLYLLPGLALVNLLWPKSRPLSKYTKIAVGVGVSLATYPILFLWADLINLHPGSFYAWLPGSLGLLSLIVQQRSSIHLPVIKNKLKQWKESSDKAFDISFIVILTTIFLTRMISVRNIDVPMWGDSYQHTMMAQLLLDNGGLFNSWQPYAELTTFTYHFGFHSHVAVFSWLTGLPATISTLWVGQALNGLAALSLFPLAERLGKSRWAGIFAVLISGLLVPMPMFYTNWGRYTQLAGQVILPIAAFTVWVFFEQRKVHRGSMVVTWLLMGGIALTHYRVLIFAILLFPILIFIARPRIGFRDAIYRTALVGFVSAGIFLPWFLRVFKGRILDNFAFQLTTPASSTSSFLTTYNSIGDISFFLPISVWLIMIPAILWVTWKRDTESLVIVGWWALIFLSANPQVLGLPGVGVISNFAVLIAMYIPASILIGYLGNSILVQRFINSTPTLSVLGLILISLWGGVNQISLIDPTPHSLVTRPDMNAAEWLKKNIPDTSRVLVNSFFAYGGTVIVGSDGGWWLPLLANVKSTVPPISYGVEQGIQPDYLSRVNLFSIQMADIGSNNPETLKALEDWGVTHIYIGQRQGSVNYNGPNILDPQDLKSNERFRVIYNIDRVWIFEVVN